MAYHFFDKNEPTGLKNGVETMKDIRANLVAMRDAVVMGSMPAWASTITYNQTDTDRIDVITLSRSSERIKIEFTYDTGNADLVKTETASYSDNDGAYYMKIGTNTFAYSGDQLIGSTWTDAK